MREYIKPALALLFIAVLFTYLGCVKEPNDIEQYGPVKKTDTTQKA